jgi:hypothetical protein
MALDWTDLLIDDVSAEDFERWTGEWNWLIEGRLAPAFMNKFGCWFLRRPEGHVEMLDVFTGTVERIADSFDEFIAQVNERSWQEVYLLSELVLRLHQAEKIPGPGQCYALAPHPALGGPDPMQDQTVDPRFVMIMEIGLWQSLCSRMVRGISSKHHDSGEPANRISPASVGRNPHP